MVQLEGVWICRCREFIRLGARRRKCDAAQGESRGGSPGVPTMGLTGAGSWLASGEPLSAVANELSERTSADAESALDTRSRQFPGFAVIHSRWTNHALRIVIPSELRVGCI